MKIEQIICDACGLPDTSRQASGVALSRVVTYIKNNKRLDLCVSCLDLINKGSQVDGDTSMLQYKLSPLAKVLPKVEKFIHLTNALLATGKFHCSSRLEEFTLYNECLTELTDIIDNG